MKKLTSILLLIFLATTACSNSISDLEDKIEAQAAKNNVEMSYAEIKKTAIYLDAWSKEDFYQEAIDEFKEDEWIQGVLSMVHTESLKKVESLFVSDFNLDLSIEWFELYDEQGKYDLSRSAEYSMKKFFSSL